jgi:hypothetical protein
MIFFRVEFVFQCSSPFPGQLANFKREIKKHMVAVFSDLEMHLTTGGHVFGAFVFHLIGMNRVRRTVRRVKVILGGSKVIHRFYYTYIHACMITIFANNNILCSN